MDLNDLERGIKIVYSDLLRINVWILSRGFKLNVAKSKAMIIGSKNKTSRIDFDTVSDVVIGAEKLAYCKENKNLGVIFDENVT